MMRFAGVSFIQFMRKHCAEAELDISCSGVAGVKPGDFDLRWEDISLTGASPMGCAEHREIIAERYGVTPDMVYTTAGSSLTAFQTIAAIFEDPGSAIIEKPVYTPLQDALAVFTYDIRSLPRWFEDDWALDFEELGRIWDPTVRVIVLSNLNNPTGAKTTDDEIKAVAEVAGRVGGYVLVDEVFREFDFDGEPGCAATIAPNVISVSSLTKVFGFRDMRIGWFIGPPYLRDRIASINDYFCVGDHYPGVTIAQRAFENIDMLIERSRKIIEDGRPLFEEWIATRDDLECVMPHAGPVAFPRLKDSGDTMGVAEKLFREEKILIAPGRFFGDPSGFRISFGIPTEHIERGYPILGRFLDEMRESG